MDRRSAAPSEETADAISTFVGNERAWNTHQNLLGMT